MNAQQTRRLEIVIGQTQEPTRMFAAEADMDGVDVEASMDLYDLMMLERVSAAYPEASVELGNGTSVYATDAAGNPFETAETAEAWRFISQTADDILNQGDWIVMDASSCCDQCGQQAGRENLTTQPDGAAICVGCQFEREQREKAATMICTKCKQPIDTTEGYIVVTEDEVQFASAASIPPSEDDETMHFVCP
jgi:hypothetical protein